MEQTPADNDLLNALNLVPHPKPSAEVTSVLTPSDVNSVNGERVELRRS